MDGAAGEGGAALLGRSLFLKAESMHPSLVNLLSRLEPVHIARTAAERSAIFRMRYAVYVDELKYPAGGADRQQRELHTPEDDLPESTLYYTGRPDAITASLRVCVWTPGRIPLAIHQQFSLSRFPDIATRTICQVSLMMAPRELRGTGRIIALSAGAVEQTLKSHPVDAMIASCVPALLPGYLRLGLRPYGGQLFSATGSMDIPLIAISADLEHARRCGSPWYPTLRRLAARGELPTRDFAPLLAPLTQSTVATEPDRIDAEVAASLSRHGSPFLRALPPPTRHRLVRGGLILSVPADVELFAEGIVNRDLFLVLDGELAVCKDGAPHRRLGPGALFGEDGFLLPGGQRAARVQTRTPCRLLHLRSGAVRRLGASRPKDAAAIYESIAQAMAQSLAQDGTSSPQTPFFTAPAGG